jgi:predicted GNAT family N-acyltransferase
MTKLQVRVVLADNERRRADSVTVRRQVFVEEQGVPADLEIDGHEEISTHFVAYCGALPVGAGRFRLKGEAPPVVKFERIATLAAMRGKGVGKAMMEAMEQAARHRYLGRLLYMHAQLSAASFYDRLGWERVGPEFEEAGIAHVAMRKD